MMSFSLPLRGSRRRARLRRTKRRPGETTMSDAAQRALDQLDIYTTMSRYCHGVDRCDLAILKSAFWPDATCNYSNQDIDAMTWAENCVKGIGQMERTLHT